MERTYSLALLLVGVIGVSSCGPIQATTNIAMANKRIHEARLAGADVLKEGERYITPAQQEYQLALLYLQKSKELEGFSKFEHAAFYAQLASDLGKSSNSNMSEEARRKDLRERIKKGLERNHRVAPQSAQQP